MEEGAVPCRQCGDCCRTGPCPFGVWDGTKCRFLLADNRCERYTYIINLPPEACAEVNPAFGAGCCRRSAANLMEKFRAISEGRSGQGDH